MTSKTLTAIVLILTILNGTQAVDFKTFFQDKTLRIDYFQTGTARDSSISIDRVYEQGAWAGNPRALIDPLNRGMYQVRIVDINSNQCIYTRGFSTIFGEYQTTGPARQGIPRTFHQSVLIPSPKRPFLFILEGRDRHGILVPLSTTKMDPADVNIIRQQPHPQDRVLCIQQNGPAHDKVDLLFVAEGYTREQWDKFQSDAKRFTEVIFSVEPFKTFQSRFNVSAVLRASAESGVDEPTKGSFKHTALSASYNALDTPRYLLLNDNRMLRDIASAVPYDYLIVLANTARYGGGGIYNDYTIFTADDRRSPDTLMHEFGHGFADLADEYFGGVAYEEFFPAGVEPHPPNITALLDPKQVKWRHLLTPGIPIPTPWGQDEMDAIREKIKTLKAKQETRIAELKTEEAPAEDIEARQTRYRTQVNDLNAEIRQIREKYIELYEGKVGVFEGAGYTPKGLYRSEVRIGMYRDNSYGPVSEEAIGDVIALLSGPLEASSQASAQEDGFKPIFDGKTLEGWQARAEGFWIVKNGAIVGETTEDHPAPVNQFITWQQGEVDDFELKLRFRFTGQPAANGGVQFRSRVNENGHVVGYQADMNKGAQYIGMLYEEGGRGILAPRGKKVTMDAQGKKSVQSLAHAEALTGTNRDKDWNDYHIIAQGNKITLKVNGLVTSEFIDNQSAKRKLSGVLAFQLHQGPPMKIEYRDIRLKRLPLAERKKLVFIAGPPSHSYAAHAHNAGALLLTRLLNENVPQIHAVVYKNGWPQDPTALDNANAVVMYCDGGQAHVLTDPSDALSRLKRVDELSRRGVGVGLLHYALIPPEVAEGGQYFTDWIGGYYQTHWSVNPFWTAEVKELPAHPVARGVKPFSIHDEWYYHMKFRAGMEGVTPLLSAVPPDATRQRPFGPHSGNPHVRARMGQAEHIAWCAEGAHGARGFGFTGAHPHWNWAHDDIRRLMLNALVWITGLEVPENGVPSQRPSLAELEANQDAPKPKNYDPAKIQRMIDSWQ